MKRSLYHIKYKESIHSLGEKNSLAARSHCLETGSGERSGVRYSRTHAETSRKQKKKKTRKREENRKGTEGRRYVLMS